MRNKRIYLAFLLILGLLMFSGCANDDGILDPGDATPQDGTQQNGTMTPDNVTEGDDGLGRTENGNGLGGAGDQNNNNEGIIDEINEDVNDLNQ